MSKITNTLEAIEGELHSCSDSTRLRHLTIELVEVLIEEKQRLIKRIDNLEQELEKHKRRGHKSRGF